MWIACLILVAVSSSAWAAERIELSFANWVSAEAATRENVEKVIRAFEAQHPGVTIKNIAIPFDQMRQQLITMSAGGNPPDVMQLNGFWPHELGAMGALIDLRTLAEPEFLADNFEGGLDAGTYQGKLYAVPFGLSPHGFWYNKNLMAQAGLDPNRPPRTIDELNAHMAILKNALGPKGIYPIGIDTTRIDYALTGFWPWILTFGGRPLYDGKVNFNTPEVRQAFEWLAMVARNGYTPLGQQIKEERELMAKNRIVYKMDGPYLVGILRSLNPKLKGQAFYDTFGVTTTPLGTVETPVTLADLHQLGISSQTKHPELAWEFVKFLVSSQISVEEYMIPYGIIPPLKSTLATGVGGKLQDPVSRAFIEEVIPSMIGGPYGPFYGSAQQFIIEGMQEVAIGGQDPARVVESVDRNLRILLGQ